MKIIVCNEKEQTKEEIGFSGKKVKELLQQLNINPETVLVIRKDEVLTEDEILNEDEQIEILSVISGG